MNTLYVLVANKGWAKLYKTTCPPEQLTLIYHQRNLINEISSRHEKTLEQCERNHETSEEKGFARTLARILNLDCQADRFNGLVVISSGEFFASLYDQLSGECQERVLGGIVPVPGLLSDQSLLSTFSTS